MRLSWEYVAGFMDGEGHVSMSSGHEGFTPRVMLSQTGERGFRLLTAIREWMAVQSIRSRISMIKHANPKWADAYRLDVDHRASVYKMLASMLPFLTIKKCEAQDVMRAIKLFPARNIGLAARVLIDEGRAKARTARLQGIGQDSLFGGILSKKVNGASVGSE